MNREHASWRWLGLGSLSALAALAALTVALVAPAGSAGQSTGDVDWPTVNGTLDGQRYSPLTQIDTTNVKGLKVAWRLRLKTLGSEDYPVVVGRTAYVTTTYGNVYALDAATGKKLWSASTGKQKNIGLAALAAVHGFPNRGVAVGGGHVYVLTPNALLLSLDQATGHIQWKASLGNPVYLSESAAPIYSNGMVFVGSAGGESGARGFEAAYNATTGKQIWRYYALPAPDAPGSYIKGGHHGGGDIWMNATIDTKANRLYIATGNPGSDLDPRVRPAPISGRTRSSRSTRRPASSSGATSSSTTTSGTSTRPPRRSSSRPHQASRSARRTRVASGMRSMRPRASG